MSLQILLLSDIHGNYPALMSIEEKLPTINFDFIINCGDSIVYAPFPNETLEWLRKREVISILGNTDKKVIKILQGKSFKKPGKIEKRIMYTSAAAELNRQNRDYLLSLKKSQQLQLYLGSKRKRSNDLQLGIFHGSPAANHEFLFDTTPDNRFRELAEKSRSDIVVTGHSHSPYHKNIFGIHFINPGSVGRMFDGNPAASCATLEISDKLISVTHHRFAYPVERVVERIRENMLPEIYCQMYREGRKLN